MEGRVEPTRSDGPCPCNIGNEEVTGDQALTDTLCLTGKRLNFGTDTKRVALWRAKCPQYGDLKREGKRREGRRRV